VEKLAPGADPSLPPRARVLGVLPRVIDTPSNRQWMAEGADTSSWTPPRAIAEALLRWAEGKGAAEGEAAPPQSGALLVAETAAGQTRFVATPA
jgi:hypothetical protein